MLGCSGKNLFLSPLPLLLSNNNNSNNNKGVVGHQRERKSQKAKQLEKGNNNKKANTNRALNLHPNLFALYCFTAQDVGLKCAARKTSQQFQNAHMTTTLQHLWKPLILTQWPTTRRATKETWTSWVTHFGGVKIEWTVTFKHQIHRV